MRKEIRQMAQELYSANEVIKLKTRNGNEERELNLITHFQNYQAEFTDDKNLGQHQDIFDDDKRASFHLYDIPFMKNLSTTFIKVGINKLFINSDFFKDCVKNDKIKEEKNSGQLITTLNPKLLYILNLNMAYIPPQETLHFNENEFVALLEKNQMSNIAEELGLKPRKNSHRVSIIIK